MSRINLQTPSLDAGIRNINFFEGRILSGRDLQEEQAANRQQHQQLAQAIGAGVVHGLTVSPVETGANGATPVVKVNQGLAINGKGHALTLPRDTEVNLLRPDEAERREAGLFAVCTPPRADVIYTGAGAYILLMAPASGLLEQAPKQGLYDDSKAGDCGFRYAVEGVQFRLLRLDIDTLIDGLADLSAGDFTEPDEVADHPAWSRLRNALAHLTLGTVEQVEFSNDPFARANGQSVYLGYGALDRLRAIADGGLSDCDVPLALIYWADSGIRFVDMWSVRRRPLTPPLSTLWPLQAGQRLLAEREAAFLQFEEQLRWLDELAIARGTVAASDYFRFLPAAAYLPVGSGNFSPVTFFTGLNVETDPLDPAFFELLFHQGTSLAPIDLARTPPIHLYQPANGANFLLFIRDEQLATPETTPPVETPEPTPGAKTGRINISVQSGVKTTALVAKLEYGENFFIWAEDSRGQRTYAEPVTTSRGVKLFADNPPAKFGSETLFNANIANFKITALPAGVYTIRLQAEGLRDQSQRRVLSAGKIIQVTFQLSAKSATGGKRKPPLINDGGYLDNGWYGKIGFIDKYIDWPWPPEKVLFRDPVIDPPPEEVDEWFKDWGDWIGIQHPDAPIDPGTVQVYIDPAHIPGARPEQPYAYAVFGPEGAYVPIVLTPADKTLGRSIAVAKAGLDGVDRTVEENFAAGGVDDLDVLAASWQGLVADVLETSLAAADSFIEEANTKVDQFQGSLLIFSGVDSALAASLAQAGIDDAIALANADPQTVATAAGISEAYALRLIEESRQVVPASDWSLAAAGLGLKETELSDLDEQGVKTIKDLTTLGESDTGRQQLGGILGIGEQEAGELSNRVDNDLSVSKGEAQLAPQKNAPVTNLFGVTKATGNALAASGFGTVGGLASAEVDKIAGLFGGDTAAATAVIDAAKGKIGISGP